MPTTQDKLNELDMKIAELKARAENAGVEARAEIRKKVNEFDLQRTKLRKQIEEFERKSATAWDDVSEGFKSAYDELHRAISDARRRFLS